MLHHPRRRNTDLILCPKCYGQVYREEIRQIALYLRAEQMSLTQKHIGRYLAQPAILRDPKVRELLREVCCELETSGEEKPL